MEINDIYNIDCMDGVKDIPDKSIHSIISDPPYFQGLTHNGKKAEFSDLSISKYFFIDLFKEFSRILRDDGCIYFFTDWRGYAFYYPIFEDILGANNMIVWDKETGPGSYYSFSHELILFHGRKMSGAGRNVICEKSFASGAKMEDGEKIHPTQKPTKLIRKLIEDSTKMGDTVLDCFIGSGTTAIAAMQTGRNYIGFEISQKYYDIAKKRIEDYKLAYTD